MSLAKDFLGTAAGSLTKIGKRCMGEGVPTVGKHIQV